LSNPVYDVVDVRPSKYGVPSVRVHHRRWLIEAGARFAKSDDVADPEEDKPKPVVRLESRCIVKTRAAAAPFLASSVFEMETERWRG
jgi:hypothetical protein